MLNERVSYKKYRLEKTRDVAFVCMLHYLFEIFCLSKLHVLKGIVKEK